MNGKTEILCRFNHHPDPAIDFCVEVEVLEGQAYEVGVGMADRATVSARIARAMEFQVGGDPGAIMAKGILRRIETNLCGDQPNG